MKFIHRLTMLLALVLIAFSFAPKAKADQIWNFAYNGTGIFAGGVFGSGTLTTSDTLITNVSGFAGINGWQITGITGQRNFVPITGIVGSDPGFIIDNTLLSDSATYGFLDNNGVLFSLLNGAHINLFSQASPTGSGYFEFVGGDPYGDPLSWHTVDLSITRASVPEISSTIGLLVLSLASIFLFERLNRDRRSFGKRFNSIAVT